MSYSSVQNNQLSSKFFLVRIEPARYIEPTSIGSGKYTVTLSGLFISKVKENGTELTLVTTIPVSGEYSFNESTGLLTIYPASAPSESNPIVVFHYLFYTGQSLRVAHEDPEDANTSLRDWLPQIVQSPTLGQSVENVLQGIFSLTTSSITLINNGDDIGSYLGINDSFYNKEIIIWHCLDSIDNIKKIFIGKISDVQRNNLTYSFSFKDNFADLKDQCVMGDSTAVYFSKSDFPNVEDKGESAPIPFFFGTVSRYQTLTETVTNLVQAKKIDPETLYKAVCTSYSTTISTSNNRTWGICRTHSGGFLQFNHTPSSIDNADANFTVLNSSAAASFLVGDTFIVDHSGSDHYSRVYYVDPDNNKIYVTKDAVIATNDTIEANNCPTIVIKDENGVYYYCLYGRDYTASTLLTSAGNIFLSITFTDNFEANHAGYTILDPTQHAVFYRVRPESSNNTHGNALKYILDKAGLPLDASTFLAADSALDTNVNFSIPYFDESDFSEYYKYVGEILGSTLGHISLNNNLEVGYYLFDSPTSATTSIEALDIIQDEISSNIYYQDIISQLIAYNPHYNSIEANATSSQTLSSNKVKQLHGINKTTRFRHVLENMTSRITQLFGFRSNRYLKYNITTKTKNFDSIIGNNFILEHKNIDASATSAVKILGINNSINNVNISASDLLGL